MLELPEESVEAFNAQVLRRMQDAVPGFEMSMFEDEISEQTSLMDELIEILIDGLHRGMTRPAIYALIADTFERLGLEVLGPMVGAFLVHIATEEFVQEQADGISSRETE